MSVPTDEELMLRVRDGDRDAFNTLMDRFERPVLNVVYRHLQDYDMAQDLMQETFLRVYKSRERYEVKAKFSTWLFQIAVNLCLNERRSRSYRGHASIEALAGQETPHEFRDTGTLHPEEELRKAETARIVREAVQSLPDEERAMVILARWEEKSYDEIAEIMGCTVDAVKSRLYRAKKMLRERLQGVVEENERT